MKKVLVLFFFSCLALICVSVYAQTEKNPEDYTQPTEFEQKAGWASEKFTRGVCNVLTGIFEIPNQIGKRSDKDGALAGMTVGVAEGFGAAVARIGAGLWDALTWPGSFIMPDEKPVIDPPTLFDK